MDDKLHEEPFGMKVKDFGNRLKTLNRFLVLMPHDKDKDTIFSDSDFKALLFKSMPISWQNAYLLKGTQVTDDFRQMLAYFVQFQGITDTQTMSKSFLTTQELSTLRQHKYTCTNHGQSCCFPSSFQGGQTHINRIPRKIKTISQGPFVDFKGPCPVHPMSSHTWGGCYNNPKNKASNSQDNSTRHDNSHVRSQYYSSRGRGYGRGCGRNFNNTPWLTNPLPTLYIKQAPTNAPIDALSTVTNTDSSTVGNPTYVLKHITQKPKRGEFNSRRLYNKVINCDTVYLDKIICCDTAAGATNNTKMALPHANYKTHHFNLLTLQSEQDGIITEQSLIKNSTHYVFDTECIQEVDNFTINIDIFTT